MPPILAERPPNGLGVPIGLAGILTLIGSHADWQASIILGGLSDAHPVRLRRPWKKVRTIVEKVFGNWPSTLVVYKEYVPKESPNPG